MGRLFLFPKGIRQIVNQKVMLSLNKV